jgi:hypothetical protein
MMRFATLIAGALALGLAAPAAAEKLKPDVAEYKAIELKNIVSGKAAINPAKAYIYIRSPQYRTNGIFMKTPGPEEIANYETKWREEFAEAKADYPKKLARYNAAKEAGRPPKDKPEEPTEKSFAIDPIDLRMIVPFGPQFVFDKTDAPDKNFSYLIEVEPGEYTYLGPLFYLPGAPVAGTCYCMGSVKFEAKAGQITSLGDFLGQGWASRAAMEAATVVREMLPDRPVKDTDWSLPESLAKYPNAKAELRAAGKRNNFLNALVGRMPPVPGVLAYDRDVPIDLVGQAQMMVTVEAAAHQQAEEDARGDDIAEADAAAAASQEVAAEGAETPPTEAPTL